MRRSLGGALAVVAVAAVVTVPPSGAPVAHADVPTVSDPVEPPDPAGDTVTGLTELPALRTASSNTYLTGTPGVYETHLFPGAINYRLPDGAWGRIDRSLQKQNDGSYHTAASDTTLTVNPPDMATGTFANLTLPSGHSVGFGLEGMLPDTVLNVVGNIAQYQQALPFTDLELDGLNQGVKESLWLNSPLTPRTFSFPLVLDGLTAHLRADGGIDYQNDDGEIEASTPPGHMTDASEATSDGVSYSLVDGPVPMLVMTLDVAWLDDPARTYPVIVDPAVDNATAENDAYVSADSGTVNFGGSTTLHVGYGLAGTSAVHNHESYLHFSGAQSVVGNDRFVSASLKLWNWGANTCAGRNSAIERITESWSSTGVTWNNRPSHTASGMSAATSNESHGINGSCDNAWIDYDVSNLVQNWLNNTAGWDNHGVAVVAGGGGATDQSFFKGFASMDNADHNPQLVITYADFTPPPAPTLTQKPDSCSASPLAQFTWTMYDDSKWDSAGHHANATSYALDTTNDPSRPGTSVDGSTNGNPTTFTYTSSQQSDGQHYFHVRNRDETGNWGNSIQYGFKIDTTPPGAPQNLTNTSAANSSTFSASWLPPSGSDLCGINGYYVWFDNNFSPVPVSGTSYSTNVSDGTHTFHVRTVDGAGNASANADLTFTKDTATPPAPTFTTTPASCTASTSATFSWTTNDNANGSGIVGSSYVVDQIASTTPDTTIDTTNGTATISGLNPSANPYWFHVRNKDAAGNWSPVAHYSFYVDTAGPATPSIASSTHPDQQKWYRSRSFAASWTPLSDPCGISSYAVSLDGGTYTPQSSSNTSYNATVSSDGTHTLQVHATDGAGNVGPDGIFNFNVDTTCPTGPTAFTSTSHVQGQPSANSRITVTWNSATDTPSGIAGYSIAFNNSAASLNDVVIDTTSTTATSASLGDGSWYAHLRAIDKAGNGGDPCLEHVIGPFVINTAGPGIVKHLLSPAPAPTGTTTVAAGQNLRYQVDITNSTGLNMVPPEITDTVDSGQQLIGTDPTLTLADGTVVHCMRANAVPSCAIEANGTRLHVASAGPFLGPNQALHLSYTTLAVGVPGGCLLSTNTATAINGASSSQAAPVQVQICDSGLGLENWWSYTGAPVSSTASAQVNVMNGNLVVEDTDGTVIQARGHLAYVQHRIYNSQDLTLPLAGSWARGWTLTVGQTESIAAAGVSASGLIVPAFDPSDPTASPLAPNLGVTLVDRDGTRHVFTYRSASIDVDHAVDVSQLPTGPARLLQPVNSLLKPGTGTGLSGFTHVCVDATYQAPAGVHLSLWRYVGTNGNCTGTQTDTAARILGYAAVRPDRLRTEFDAYGRLVDMIDGSGVDLRYVYETTAGTGVALPTGRLTQVYEPRSCTGSIGGGSCRATRVSYSDTDNSCSVPSGYGATQAVCVTDPAGRITVYGLNDAHYLLVVVNPPETGDAGSGGDDHTVYSYSGINGASSCGGAVGTLCTVTDNRGKPTSFTYQNTGLVGASRVVSFTDRMPATTAITYDDAAHTVTADTGSHRARYTNIDSAGRVGEIDEGTTTNAWQHQTRNTWDTANAATNCTITSGSTTGANPTKLGRPDNELCTQDQLDPASGAVVASTRFTYNPQGAVLSEAHLIAGNNYAVTTHGYDTQYAHDNNSSSTVVTDSPTGNGAVSAGDHATALADSHLLFAITDHTATVSPNGNNAGSNFAAYETTYAPARATSAQPSTPPSSSSACPTRNTGELCSESDPVQGGFAVTNYGYDTFGQRTSAARQQAPGGTTLYDYYDSSGRDLSGTVSAEGWLRSIKDPTGHFVYIAYDQAGNPARRWDRNRTSGDPDNFSPATAVGYAETLHATDISALPWRYVLSETDPMGNIVHYDVDAAGDQTGITDARGNTTVQTFDDAGNLTTSAAPTDPNKPERYAYDAFGNLIQDTKPEGGITLFRYDSVNRLTDTISDRGAGSVGNQNGCRASTSGDAPIPTGHVVCTTHTGYDAIDDPITVTDGAGATTTATYDGMHRLTSQTVPRSSTISETTRTVYDADGNATDICPPRSAADGGATTCSPNDRYGTHYTFDPADRKLTSSHYRGPAGGPLTTSFDYDAFGNLTAVTDPNGHTTTNTYDVLDRLIETTAPRDNSVEVTTTYTYDAVGNRTSISTPGVDTGDASGQNVTLDGADCPQSNPCPIPNNANYKSLRLVNGAWATAATTTPRPVLLNIAVTGILDICASCGITVDGLGYRGGNGGSSSPGSDGAGPGGGHGSVNNAVASGGGGGAGHGTGGGDGAQGLAGGTTGGAGGAHGTRYGSEPSGAALVSTDAGSGGGGAGSSGGLLNLGGGRGGDGGGAIHITAGTLTNNGIISALGMPGSHGVAGASGTASSGGGGGGSGGSIWLTANTLTTGSLRISGGAGGAGGTTATGTPTGTGGQGGWGYLRLDSANGATYTPGQTAPVTTHSTNRLTLFTYDRDNRLVDTITGASTTSTAWRAPSTDGGADVRTRQAYDADGNVVAAYDPRAFTDTATPDPAFAVRYDYDTSSRLVAEYHPRYDANHATDTGLSSAQTDQCQTTQPASTAVPAIAGYATGTGVCVTRYGYDANGNRTLTTLPTSTGSDNRKLTYHYTPDDLLDHINGPDPRQTHADTLVTVRDLAYDGDGRTVTSATASGITTTVTYTLDGLTKTVTTTSGDQPHTTTYTYDANGAPKDRTRTITSTTSETDNVAVYNFDGTLASITDAAGDKTSYDYDNAGNVTAVYSPNANDPNATTNTAGTPTRYTYTDDNLVKTITVPVSPDGTTTLRRTTYNYDLGGRRTTTDADEIDSTGTVTRNGAKQRLAYYPDDRPATQTGRNSETITHLYDPAGNTLTLTYTPANGDPTVTTTGTYYLDGLPRTVGERSRTTTYSYDAAGTLAAQANSGTTTSYMLSDAEQQRAISSDVTGNQAVTIDFDLDGRPKTTSYPNGTSWTRTYKPDGTLGSQDLTGIAKWQYAYDGLGRVTAAGLNATSLDCSGTPATGLQCFSYDSADRLTRFSDSDGTRTATYDRDGNRLTYGISDNSTVAKTTHQTYNADDSTATIATGSANPTTLTYTPFGGRKTDDCATYSYDGLDHVTARTTTDSNCGPSTTYTYDGLDRQTTINQTGGAAAGITRLHYFGWTPALTIETEPNGEDTTYSDAPRFPIAVKRAGTTQYLAGDGRGNITTSTANDGTLACEWRFDPWGTPINIASNPAAGQTCTNANGQALAAVGFANARRDTASGTYQFGARTYDTRSGGFLTADSYARSASAQDAGVGMDPLTRNTYTYVNGDPINYVDPTGHVPCMGRDNCGPIAAIVAAAPAVEADEYQAAAVSQAYTSLSRCVYMTHDLGCAERPEVNSVLPPDLLNPDTGSVCGSIGNPLHLGPFLQSACSTLGATPSSLMGLADFSAGVTHVVGDVATGHPSRALQRVRHAGSMAYQSTKAFAQDLSNVSPPGFVFNSIRHGPGFAVNQAQVSAGHLLPAALLALATGGIGGAGEEVGGQAFLRTSTSTIRTIDAAEGAPRAIEASTRVNPWAGNTLSRVANGDDTMYRVWGGESGQAGDWLTPIRPTSSAEARAGLALPGENAATYVSEVTIPAGTRFQIGIAGEAFDMPGGWVQAQLMERIPLENFGKGVLLEP